jgi:hypothetical protein
MGIWMTDKSGMGGRDGVRKYSSGDAEVLVALTMRWSMSWRWGDGRIGNSLDGGGV